MQDSSQKTLSKFEKYISRAGRIFKFTDHNLGDIHGQYAILSSRIRSLSSSAGKSYFFQIEKPGEFGVLTSSIEESDLAEIIKSLAVLREESHKDANGSYDYLENKFVTDDGFKIGYFIDKNLSPTWFVSLDNYSNDGTVIIDNLDALEKLCVKASGVIAELKRN